MEDEWERAFLLVDEVLSAEVNKPTMSVETLEQQVLVMLTQLRDPSHALASSWQTPERVKQLDTAIAMLEMTIKIMRTRQSQDAHRAEAGESSAARASDNNSNQRAPDKDAVPPKITSRSSTSGSSKGKTDELDNFRDSRKSAIERTIVSDTSLLPRFDDLIGLAEAKQALREALIDPITYPEWFASSDLKPWRCVLLYGPPGTGKTQLSQSCARETNSRFYQVSSSDLISAWTGESERLIRELFDHALSYKGASVIFVDEIDSLCRIRSTAETNNTRRVKTELLLQVQRVHSSKSQTVLVCATNCPWELDSAFLRRFEKRIFVGLPNTESRVALLQKFLSKTKVASDVDWSKIANLTEGYSGDDLRRLAQEVAFFQFRKYKEDQASQVDYLNPTASQVERVPVTASGFLEVIQSFSPSVSHETLRQYDQYKSA